MGASVLASASELAKARLAVARGRLIAQRKVACIYEWRSLGPKRSEPLVMDTPLLVSPSSRLGEGGDLGGRQLPFSCAVILRETEGYTTSNERL